ncbi:hypothetical protein [Bailinhaonella thermotolerans]|uniref:Uncharacterized protein n=1 Tax=Bailinhaonella thermotolerans TaxID=1070861 RepID=A0A3A3ZYJ6_9ACTN|nr:hypothetical protein [Bailinhaonella thermotolerans]RJL19975.1 hypothetical protein D5H75_40005 [Bailinhaonella thermotolerans]
MVVVDGEDHANLLYAAVRDGGHTPPGERTGWGLRAVRRDAAGARSSRHDFAFPGPGHWAHAGPPGRPSACQAPGGDGLCLGTTQADPGAPLWPAVSCDGTPADHLLLVAYRHEDVLDVAGAHLRVRRLLVVADLDGVELIRAHGTGADLRGLRLGEPGRTGLGPALMRGATWDEAEAARQAGIALAHYAYARCLAAHQEILDAHAAGIVAWQYADARAAGAGHEQILDARAAGLPMRPYVAARRHGLTHIQALVLHASRIDIIQYVTALTTPAAT